MWPFTSFDRSPSWTLALTTKRQHTSSAGSFLWQTTSASLQTPSKSPSTMQSPIKPPGSLSRYPTPSWFSSSPALSISNYRDTLSQVIVLYEEGLLLLWAFVELFAVWMLQRRGRHTYLSRQWRCSRRSWRFLERGRLGQTLRPHDEIPRVWDALFFSGSRELDSVSWSVSLKDSNSAQLA